MCKKDDLHIAIIKYGRDKMETGVTFKDLLSHINGHGYAVSEERLQCYFGETYETLDLAHRAGGYAPMLQDVRYSLTIESTFRLIEYEEFVSANKSSFRAMVVAISAIVISIITTFLSN